MTRITPDDIQLAPAPRSRDEAAAGPAPEPGAPSRPAPAWVRP
ncbi:SPOR domain-containing protein, partial [Glycocaulis profundi]